MTEPLDTVVGAVIVRGGRVLAARRSRPAELAGYWEFPGGKVEPGEEPRVALVREIKEELGAVVEVGQPIQADAGPWPISDRYELVLFLATVSAGEPEPGSDHDELVWLDPSELGSVRWLASDHASLGAVRRALGLP